MKKGLFITLMSIVLAGVIVASAAVISENPLSGSKKSEREFKTYEEIYKILEKKLPKDDMSKRVIFEGNSLADAGFGEATSTGSTVPFSTTNIQEKGVDEADIIKTDGEYIYYLMNECIYIVKINKGKSSLVSKIEFDSEKEHVTEMYLSGSKLIVIRSKYSEFDFREYVYDVPSYSSEDAVVDFYNVSDKTSPKKEGSYTQSGYYQTSRLIGDFLYIITNKTNYVDEIGKRNAYLPYYFSDGDETVLPEADIFVNPDIEKAECPADYSVIGGLNIEGKGVVSSVKAMLGYNGQVYSSTTNMYIAGYEQLKEKTSSSSGTRLMRFSMKDGMIKQEGKGTVEGTVDDQFSMSEKGDTFRIVTTVVKNDYIFEDEKYSDNSITEEQAVAAATGEDRRTTSLNILDLDFKPLGAVKNLAPGERIYSCRFIGDVAYFVTFKNVDPLFAVDLSNPVKPIVLSELKIPGFSDYLHPFGEGLLLGIGMDADEETGETTNVKLSMFDISDPKQVEENHSFITKESHSSVLYNHKALLADSGKNIIAFPGESNYMIYSYDKENGFTLEKALKFTGNDEFGWGEARGVYIGDYIYAVGSGGVISVDMRDFALGEPMYFYSE